MFLPNGILGAARKILSTKKLSKSFGSLVVAQDVELELPQGVRHALIGPNGAGKTTLINLMTGMLAPDARPDPARRRRHHRRSSPTRACSRGLARTFQINTPVPAADGAGIGGAGGARARRRMRTTGGAACPLRTRGRRGRFDPAILESATAPASVDARAGLWRSSACSRSRSRSPRGRACCCSTSPPPACPRTRAPELFAAIAGLPSDAHRALHRARHGCRVPLREPHHRDGRRPDPGRRARRRRSRATRACARSTWEGRTVSLLELRRRSRRLRRRRRARRHLARAPRGTAAWPCWAATASARARCC